jgi:hypothetical protein
VPAGGRVRHSLVANMIPWGAVDGEKRWPDVRGGFSIDTSKLYPTPAT